MRSLVISLVSLLMVHRMDAFQGPFRRLYPTGNQTVLQVNDEPGEPLFLTPYLEQGQAGEARRLRFVIRSFARQPPRSIVSLVRSNCRPTSIRPSPGISLSTSSTIPRCSSGSFPLRTATRPTHRFCSGCKADRVRRRSSLSSQKSVLSTSMPTATCNCVQSPGTRTITCSSSTIPWAQASVSQPTIEVTHALRTMSLVISTPA